MSIEQEVLDEHVIYGYWNAEESAQFLVFYPESGDNCQVFIMGGADYGGGISYYFNCPYTVIDDIISNNPNLYAKGVRDLVENLPEAIAARKKQGVYYGGSIS